ncbi:unnamed protein product [Ectocarpus fasciculatus]
MRADIFWSAAWSTCFIGGVILGSTGPANTLAFGSSSPSLRGSGSAQSQQPSLLPETIADGKDETVATEKEAAEKEIKAPISTKQQEEEEPGATGGDEDAAASITPPTKNRSLGSSGPDGDLDLKFDESLVDDQQPPLSAFGLRRSKIAQRVNKLNGGLWGPNEEEEEEIAKELAGLREEDPSSSQEDVELLYYSYDYDFDDGGVSYSYDYEAHNF